jgi:GNAT superfamily N-acetyltransferase
MSERSDLTLRPLTAADVPSVAAWLARLPLMQRYAYTEESATFGLNSALRSPDTWLLAACLAPDQPVIGLAWALEHGTFGRAPYLRLLAVREDVHSAGIGAALLQAVEDHVRPTAKALYLLVSDFNTAAQRFYARHGYEQIGEIRGFVLPQVVEFLLCKRL